MRRLLGVLLALSLGAPSTASAAGHLWLDARASLPRSPGSSRSWELALQATTDDNLSEAGRPDLGSMAATLHLEGRGFDEWHGYGNVRVDELSFDGMSGRLRLASSSDPTLAADLRIDTAGLSTPYLGMSCAASPMLQVRVLLSGSMTLRTSTRFFGTKRIRALTGTMLYNDGPPGPCFSTPDAPPRICSHGRVLGSNTDTGPRISLRWESPRIYRYARVEYGSRLDGDPAPAAWTHTIDVALFRNPFSGPVGSLRAALPDRGLLRGFARFQLARREHGSPDPACPGPTITRGVGTLTGRFVAAFHGWGTKTLVLRRAAGYLSAD